VKREVHRLGIAMIVAYSILFVWLTVVQVVRADSYNSNPANNRSVVRDYGRPRGQILTADGAVLAMSEADDSSFGRVRLYPEHDLFAQVTGFFSFTFGSDGVERSYNDELAGRTGARSIDSFVDALLDQENTNDVVLTLSKSVQEVARAELGDRQGTVVALDPRDGSIIALWSFPSYDPQPISQTNQAEARVARELTLAAPGNPLLPKAYRETYFPGSTFKVVTSSGGLRDGVTATSPVYPVTNQYVPPQTNQPIRNFGGSSCGGDLFNILRVSCNTAFAQMGVDIGADFLVGAANDIGFGDAPPLDLPRPAESPIADVDFFEKNVPLLAQTAIGQNTVRATPLQMALVAAAIANGGSVPKPHVMKEVLDEDGEVIDRYDADEWRRAMTPGVAATIRDAMIGVVENGTATRLAVPGVPTAGKTGTAQTGQGTSHAWIIGFAPADAPRVAVAVIVEGQPSADEATGGRVAAPIGRAVLEAALQVVR
jgi:penicillin-binding protein A